MNMENLTKEEYIEYLLKLWEPQEVNISKKELSEIRKKFDKALFKIDSEYFEGLEKSLMPMYELNLQKKEDELEDYFIVFKNEEEYNNELKDYIKHGGSKKEFKQLVKEESKRYSKKYNEVTIMECRFKHKYSWSKISQEVGLSERQCQRIKDNILNSYIVDILKEKNYIIFNWENGF